MIKFNFNYDATYYLVFNFNSKMLIKDGQISIINSENYKIKILKSGNAIFVIFYNTNEYWYKKSTN